MFDDDPIPPTPADEHVERIFIALCGIVAVAIWWLFS